jgi:hypothetical protein
MKTALYLLFILFFISCNDGNITLEEARKIDTLSETDFNRILRKEHDLALEGLKLIETANEDTAARRRLLTVNEQIDDWRDLVKEKLPDNFTPSEQQKKMFNKVLEFKDRFASFR